MNTTSTTHPLPETQRPHRNIHNIYSSWTQHPQHICSLKHNGHTETSTTSAAHEHNTGTTKHPQHTYQLSDSCSLFHTHWHTISHTHACIHTLFSHTHSLSLSLSHTHTHFLSLFHSHRHPPTHTNPPLHTPHTQRNVHTEQGEPDEIQPTHLDLCGQPDIGHLEVSSGTIRQVSD